MNNNHTNHPHRFNQRPDHNHHAHKQEATTPPTSQHQKNKGKAATQYGLQKTYNFVSLIGHYGLMAFGKIGALLPHRWRQRTKVGKHTSPVVTVILSIFLVSFVSLAVLYYTMGTRALPIGFLKQKIAQQLATNFNDADVSIDQVYLQRDTERGGLIIRLSNMVLRERGGGIIAASPEMAIGLKSWPLLIGTLAPDSLSLIEPEVHLVRDAQGAWNFWSSQKNEISTSVPIPAVRSEDNDRPTQHLANLGDFVSQGLQGAHRQLQRSKNLSFIGVRRARLVLHSKADAATGQELEIWELPAFNLQYDQEDEKRLIGSGVLKPQNAPQSEIFLAMTHRQGDEFFDVKSRLHNVVPSELSRFIPALSSLIAVNLGVTGDFNGRVDLHEGLHSGQLNIALSKGEIGVFGQSGPNFHISGGRFEFGMEAGAKHVILHKGELTYPSGWVTLKGDIWRESEEVGPGDWRFQLYSTDGKMQSTDPEVNGKSLDEFSFAGRLFANKNPISIDELRVEIGKSRLLIAHDGSSGYPAILRGSLHHFPLSLVRAVWPTGFLPETRKWMMEDVTSGIIQRGNFSLSTSGDSQSETELSKPKQAEKTAEAAKLPKLDLKVVNFAYRLSESPVLVSLKKVNLSVEGKELVAKFPKGQVRVPASGQIHLSEGQFLIPDLNKDSPQGIYQVRLKSEANTMLAFLKQPPISYKAPHTKKIKNLKGNVKGKLKLSMPLKDNLTTKEIDSEGLIRVQNTSFLVNDYAFKNGSLSFQLGRNNVETKGKFLINGAAATLKWQQQFNQAATQKQTPFFISGTFDEADRNQLGLPVNQFVQGSVPVEVALTPKANDKLDIHVSADLTNATLISQGLGWRKEAGRSGQLTFDVIDRGQAGTELSKFHIDGDDLTARGHLVLNKEGEVERFEFPKISYKVVSNISLKGQRIPLKRKKNKYIWQVQAKGKTYDGRGLLRSMLHTGQVGGGRQGAFKAADGFDLSAKFNKVLGWHQSNLTNVQLAMKRRGDELKAFQFNGMLPHKKKMKGTMKSHQGGDPVIEIETNDAGEALRFVGFYPNMLSGWGRLNVRYNVKKRQLASQTGRLLIKDFAIASDPVVKEVLANLNNGKKGKTNSSQDKVKFGRLAAPFSIGHQQFILHDTYLKGDVLGATMRGQIDFKQNRVRLAGTYIPLYGLNAAVGAVPVLGDILVGRRGEGILGITFGVYGDLRKPEVLVNPMSLVAPGVFRQIFEFQQQTPQIKARSKSGSDGKVKLDASSSKVRRLKQGEAPPKRIVPETSSSLQRK